MITLIFKGLKQLSPMNLATLGD